MEELRMRLGRGLYKNVIKPICFNFDPEHVHNAFVRTGMVLGSNLVTRKCTEIALSYQNQILQQNLMGIKFRNPVGLSAGFDKDAEAAMIMKSVGFGFAEIGSITANPCRGNEGVRLRRITERSSILVHLGLNNKGAAAVHQKMHNRSTGIPIIVSVAKTNCKETTDPGVGLKDYLFTIKTFRDTADIFELNISCPNAFGGQDFANPELFERLAKGIEKLKVSQPVIVKMSPDLGKRDINRIVEISAKHHISGFVCSNLTKNHKLGDGGLSGKTVEKRANSQLSYIYRKSLDYEQKFILIGVGGIFSAEDAYKKIRLGANLVELITGMIYEGPQLIGEINHDLVELLNRDGFKNIGEVVGTASQSRQR